MIFLSRAGVARFSYGEKIIIRIEPTNGIITDDDFKFNIDPANERLTTLAQIKENGNHQQVKEVEFYVNGTEFTPNQENVTGIQNLIVFLSQMTALKIFAFHSFKPDKLTYYLLKELALFEKIKKIRIFECHPLPETLKVVKFPLFKSVDKVVMENSSILAITEFIGIKSAKIKITEAIHSKLVPPTTLIKTFIKNNEKSLKKLKIITADKKHFLCLSDALQVYINIYGLKINLKYVPSTSQDGRLVYQTISSIETDGDHHMLLKTDSFDVLAENNWLHSFFPIRIDEVNFVIQLTDGNLSVLQQFLVQRTDLIIINLKLSKGPHNLTELWLRIFPLLTYTNKLFNIRNHEGDLFKFNVFRFEGNINSTTQCELIPSQSVLLNISNEDEQTIGFYAKSSAKLEEVQRLMLFNAESSLLKQAAIEFKELKRAGKAPKAWTSLKFIHGNVLSNQKSTIVSLFEHAGLYQMFLEFPSAEEAEAAIKWGNDFMWKDGNQNDKIVVFDSRDPVEDIFSNTSDEEEGEE